MGGSDPIPGLEDLVGGGGGVPAEVWGQARNITTATSVPDDFSAWTTMTLSDIDVAAGQSDILETSGKLELAADEGGTYLLTLAAKAESGGSGTGPFQIAINLLNFAGTVSGRIKSPIVEADWGRAEEQNEMQRLVSFPGEQGNFRWLGVGVRCSGNSVDQDVKISLVARRLYMDSGSATRAFVYL